MFLVKTVGVADKATYNVQPKQLLDETFHYQLLGEMQRIAFRLLLPSCVCVCVCLSVSVCLWTPGKRFEIETSLVLNCAK